MCHLVRPQEPKLEPIWKLKRSHYSLIKVDYGELLENVLYNPQMCRVILLRPVPQKLDKQLQRFCGSIEEWVGWAS